MKTKRKKQHKGYYSAERKKRQNKVLSINIVVYEITPDELVLRKTYVLTPDGKLELVFDK